MFYILSHVLFSLLLFSDDLLRILTGKKHPKTKLQRLQKKTNINVWLVGTSK